ncbi:phage late control D family protein [Shinella sumterensis]|uniref:Contractile injection system protein, VgrG/Pvc8 family n=1 Tax=Shinella sumterensis TaxID=1967501 RepID=A0AA50H816_9HYPH|nr:contractile injection system protein, VgrG/Pvc8 family [Shinella sumterensis]WLR98642.1 contractile injection system protein, VgrG/Pvc8 family [Shinella sumterensis]
MKPRIEITIDGQPVAGAFYERLISVTVTDKEEGGADTFDMELNDGPPQFLAIPRKGAVVDIRMGYGTTRSLGRFTADKVTPKFLPYSMSIGGKSADLRSGKLKEKQERHWDKKKLKDIVSEVATESGLSASVDSDIGDFEYEWFGQQDESNVQMLQRLADRHNALFAVKGGKLVFSKRGSGLSASGTFAGTVIVTPDMVVQGSGSFESNDETKYSKVVAYYQDKDKAERVEVAVDADADGDSVYRITEPFSSLAEADKAAQAKANDRKRFEGSASVTVIGDTAITAGSALLFSGIRPGLDGVPYVIDTATHKYDKSGGYTTAISAKLYDGKSGNGGKAPAAANDNRAGTKTVGETGTVAKDSPAGTPATPDGWSQYQRNGLTDAN